MPRANRVCKVCGKSYYYCPSCAKGGKNVLGGETWHALVESEECHMVFDTLQQYFLKKLTAQEAWNLVKDYDLSIVTNEAMKTQLKELQEAAEASEVKPSVSEVSKPNVNEAVKLNVSEVEAKPRTRRKKKEIEPEVEEAKVEETTPVVDKEEVADENPVNEIN